MLLNMVMFKVTICDFGKMNINMTDKIEKKESSELITKSDQLVGVDNIEPLIKIIRGQQVMLDRDLATLYGVETKRLNEQVKRNIKRFPEDFMFQLAKDECLRSQIATLNEGRGQHLKYMPYVFTENGVAMLSSVLRSDTAIEVNIRIMRAFTSMRHFLQKLHHLAPISKQAQSLFSTHLAPSVPRPRMSQSLPLSEDIKNSGLPRLLSHAPM